MTSDRGNQSREEQSDAKRSGNPHAGDRPFASREDAEVIIQRVESRLRDLPLATWRAEADRGDRKDFKPHGFESSRAHTLRSNWSELEMNLRSVFTHYAHAKWFDARSAEELIDILEHAVTALNAPRPNLAVVDDDLGRGRRLFVWLIPPEWIAVHVQAVGALLKASEDEKAKTFNFVATGDDRRYELDDAIGVLNETSSAWATNSGLQKRHLAGLRNGALAILAVMFVLAPILVSRTSLTAWGVMPLGSPGLLAYLTTAGIAVIGAAGALLSAFLQRRDRPVTLRDYEVRDGEVWGRAAVGATIAVLAYFLLSFNVMPAMSATSPGTYLLVAFIAGFSERYIVGLLAIDKISTERPPTSMTPSGPPPKPTSTTGVPSQTTSRSGIRSSLRRSRAFRRD